jgi:hypothetical protein
MAHYAHPETPKKTEMRVRAFASPEVDFGHYFNILFSKH